MAKHNKGDLVRILGLSAWYDVVNNTKRNMLGNIYPIESVLGSKDSTDNDDYANEIEKGFTYIIARNFFKEDEVELVYQI